jgi:aminoglycoside 6'-N-acetyltransferase I
VTQIAVIGLSRSIAKSREREEVRLTVATEVRILRAGDEGVLAIVARDVFDEPIDPTAAREFLADARHHIAVVLDDGVVVGFASGVHYVHPDKPRPELWVNEVGVASTHLGQGLGKAVLLALLDAGRKLGCTEAWVLTDRGNLPAMRMYASSGGIETPPDSVMFTFRFDG